MDHKAERNIKATLAMQTLRAQQVKTYNARLEKLFAAVGQLRSRATSLEQVVDQNDLLQDVADAVLAAQHVAAASSTI